MNTLKALTLSLGELKSPIITKYQLGLIIYGIYRKKEYKGESIALQKETASSKEFHYYQRKLVEDGILSNTRDLPQSVYVLLGNDKWAPDEAACTIDPFAYVSHLSAMEHHGITDRMPKTLYLSSPRASEWKMYSLEKMKKDLDTEYETYCQSELPPLSRTQLKKIKKKNIHISHSKHLGAFKNAQEKTIRVATIGRTFLDMLRNPEICGGINHVLQVFDNYAETYLRLIIDEIDQNGKAIDKVRAGYIITERIKIEDPRVTTWQTFAQRGGSRKLDASAEYIATWSDRWCLSINTFERT